MAVPIWLQRILQHHRLPYQEHHHAPVYSASHLAQAEHAPGSRVAKTVFLALGDRPVAIVLPASARLNLSRVEAVLGRKQARLATEAEIAGWFKGCPPGTVPPLRLRANELILMDRSLAHLGTILFPAGTPELAISVPFRAWYRMVRPGVGRFALPAGERTMPQVLPTVLVVEDETDTNELLCRFLEREGFSCQGVEQGRQAVAIASKVKPAAILLDLMLPDMSGFDVCECLRRDGRLRRTPVVMLTALDDDDSRRRGCDAGAAAYLTKPFEPNALVAELQMALADAGA
jgi:CheY-like chemotaxis protein/prolyl-tRNA editing enzyme YbaK/EbsC (Cys-tRNA(Pro) deacylase)